MCGIFGVIARTDPDLPISKIKVAIDKLFLLSESRGKEAAGIAYLNPESIYVAKYAETASQVIKKNIYKEIFDRNIPSKSIYESIKKDLPVCVMGHSRLVTNGGQQYHDNNQPAISSGIVAVHNGIITNSDDLWLKNSYLKKSTQLDTEIFLALLRENYKKTENLPQAVHATYAEIEGVASIIAYFEDINCVLMTTNNGSLYLGSNKKKGIYIFASEKYILTTFAKSQGIPLVMQDLSINQVEPGEGIIISLDTLALESFRFDQEQPQSILLTSSESSREIIDISIEKHKGLTEGYIPNRDKYILPSDFIDEYPNNMEAVKLLRRCTKCILPETMPFIEFDDNGVCNYCRNYQPINYLGLDALLEELEPYRKKNNEPDCLVTFSGGRDSSYAVHLLKNLLKMHPVTYTYDWGMITDLGRRNQMRICGKLGLENILVSADIGRKRKNIRKNILAWLRNPDLGTIPLFMAGDKQYFYYANKVGEQTNSKVIVLGENLLETTRFKTGFCGIKPRFGDSHTYTLSLANKFMLAMYYAKQYLVNPAYINSSLLDTLGAYISYYFIPHNYLNIYQYLKWDEQEIDRTLIEDYKWETAKDTKTTWRIGDGTASFYNYIYFTMAGFTENDTFRSNQVREGMITREEALAKVNIDNKPRYESIQWYCDIIGIDFGTTLRSINLAPKLYQTIH